MLESTAGILIKQFSDHHPYFIFIDNAPVQKCPPKLIKIHIQNEKAMWNFASEITNSNIMEKLDKNSLSDPSKNYKIITEVLEKANHKHMPYKLVKFKKHKHKHSQWITNGILKSIKYRDNLHNQLKRLNPTSIEHVIKTSNLKTYNSILKRSIRAAKLSYYEQLFNSYKNDARKTWKTINEILHRSIKKRSLPEYFKNRDNKITDNVEIANYFNSFFTNIGKDLANKIKDDSNNNYSYYLTRNSENRLQFQETNEESILKIIDNFPAKSSSGCDGITLKQLKYLKYVLINPLTILINQILNTGIFPDKMKIAKVIPIFKNEDQTSFCKYRPISLLPVISKVIEKVIYNQMYSFFTKHQLFNDNQYGFRSGHSTEHAILEVIDRTIPALDSNETPINIFLDLSKAFDTLDHSILLGKLQFYGMDADALKLMESYLKNRKQYVIYNDSISETLPNTTGVPQGSILGPLLFLIYINDLPNSCETFKYIMYADETTLFTTIQLSNTCPTKDIEYNLNSDLNKINEWLKINKLSLNVKKSKYIIHKLGNKQVNNLLLKIDETVIERVQHFNLLGITLQENLSWDVHIKNISIKCSKLIGILNKLKRFLPLNIKVTLYNALMLPYINYCLMVWGFSCNRIIKLQKN